jgi:dihydrofolate reductase
MRKVVYSVAMSLDGFIAGPNGEADWIVMDPDIDFGSMFARFDTIVMGRKTYEVVRAAQGAGMPGFRSYVFSRTLDPSDCPGVTLADDAATTVSQLRSGGGKDIWLFGGGHLFGSLAPAGLVDRVEVAVIPVMLGDGVPMWSSAGSSIQLRLIEHAVFATTGTVVLTYEVRGAPASNRAAHSA